MVFISFHDVCFQYPQAKNLALDHIDLAINEGDFVMLCGETGSGKSTLLRQLKKGTCPAGERTGEIYYDGLKMEDIDDMRAVCEIGMVFQDPDSQLVMENVWHELAFSLENLGLPKDQMRSRIAEMASFFGLEGLMQASMHTLSGGQKRMVCLASVLILRPKVLLLDEPISALDPIAAREFLQMLHRIHEEFGTTIIVSEHCLDEVLPLANRVIVMGHGNCICVGEVQNACRALFVRDETRMLLPGYARLFLEYGGTSEIPLTVRQARIWIKDKHFQTVKKALECAASEHTIECKNINFSYESGECDILKNLNLKVNTGEILAIMGGNGTGKSTLLKLLARIYAPRNGKLFLKGMRYNKIGRQDFYRKVGYLGQNPRLYFTHDTVKEELSYLCKKLHVSDELVDKQTQSFGLQNVLHQHPCDLSGGQQQRLVLLMVLLAEPQILLLDEPTSGLDAASKKMLCEIIKERKACGTTVILVTHDMEFAARCATRCAMLFDGEITSIAEPNVFFHENYFYTTTMARIMREKSKNVLCVEDVHICSTE